MAQQEKVWYYAKGGQKFGPYSGTELRTIAQSGKIATNDLIWKEGLANWVPASSAKGLLPVATPAAPPPLPQENTSTTSQAAPLAGEKSLEKNATNHASPVSSPAFWNPLALSNWSFVLTPVFGSYLVAENYRSMGKAKEVKGAMEWLYISAAVMLSGLLLTTMFGVYGFGIWMFGYVTNFLIWNFRSARRQNQEILSTYGKSYERQPWGKVLAVGIVVVVIWQMIARFVIPQDVMASGPSTSASGSSIFGSNMPSASDAKKQLSNYWGRCGKAIKVVDFKKINGVEHNPKRYTMTYSYSLEFVTDIDMSNVDSGGIEFIPTYCDKDAGFVQGTPGGDFFILTVNMSQGNIPINGVRERVEMIKKGTTYPLSGEGTFIKTDNGWMMR
jgi:hypothetical protein